MFAIRVEYTRWAGQAEENAPQARRPRGRHPLTGVIVLSTGARCAPSGHADWRHGRSGQDSEGGAMVEGWGGVRQGAEEQGAGSGSTG